MYLFRIFLIHFWVLSTNSDPDLEFCNETYKLDSGVYSANGNTYFFKGPYYWTAGNLDKQKGLTGFANLIKNKWPEINEPIISGFTLLSKSLTVLVTKSHWFAYENDAMVSSGPTANWPQFQSIKINAMFSIDQKKNRIFAVYDDSHQYLIYDFENLSAPKLNHSGKTAIGGRFMWFIDDRNAESSNHLKSLFNLMISFTFDRILMFIGSNRLFCKINLKLGYYEKQCLGTTIVNELLGCPLNIAKRKPSTTTKKTTPGSGNPYTVWNPSEDSLDRSESTDSSITDINGDVIGSKEDTESDYDTSKIIFAVIIGVIVVIVITVLIAIIIIIFGKKSKNKIRKRGNSSMASRKSIASVETITSETGETVASKSSITSLRDSKT